VLLLDTDTVNPGDRAEAVVAATRYARVPAELTHEPGGAEVHARMDLWEMGAGADLLHRTSTGIRLRRTPKQVREIADDRVALTLLGPGQWRFSQRDVDRVERSDGWGVILVDQTAPYEFVRVGSGSTYAFGVDHQTLGLSHDTLRAAAGRLRSSPLHDMVTRHVRDTVRVVDAIPPGPAATALGSATVELLRTFLVTAAHGAVGAEPPDTLLIRTRLYVQRHLAEPGLTADRIARAHNVSVRQLYAAWARHGESLANYVIVQRLALAHRILSGPHSQARTIAAVARSCGFVDTPHFSRRFRDAYGMSPREWRLLNRRHREDDAG